MTPAKAYGNDDPPELCECGHFLKGQMSVKRGWCGTCERDLRKGDSPPRLTEVDVRRKTGRWDGEEWDEGEE